ncbi:MAG: C1 family peptidase [Muribaculaceae bacterium]|nr:C1 family peptidase [Muribaculaceae bacterium]
MRKTLAIILAAAVGFSISADDKEKTDSVGGFRFVDVKVNPTSAVKDQNKSGTCWCFAGTTYFEDEILHNTGKELDLSEMYTVRQCYIDKADKYIRTNGNINFAQGGSILDVPYVWKRYGAIPEQVYAGLNYGEDKHSHYEMAAALKAYLDAVNRNPNKRLSTAWKKGFEAILDAYLGPVPETFEFEGVTYTPRSFADAQGLKMDDYIPVTSFTHHPFYDTFAVEVADNWLWGQYYNVPVEEMKAIVDSAIDNGYTVVWAADVSEGGFNWQKGYAVMPKAVTGDKLEGTELARWVHMSDKERAAKQFKINGPADEIEVTQQSRQDMFDRQETTDDHGMVIVGRAKDQNGNNYYKVKNSWDTNQVYDGFFYVSEPYFLSKTMNVLVNRNAIPKEIAKKMKLK